MRRWRAPLLFLLLAATGLLAIQNGWLEGLADREWLAARLDDHGLSGWLMVASAGTLYTALGAPRQLLALACGYAMGAVGGALFATGLTTFGAAGAFYTARWLLRPTLQRRFGPRMARFDRAVRRQPMLKVLTIRLLPVGSNLLTNLLAGASAIPIRPFLAGSALGYLPQMAIFALAGAGLESANRLQLLLGLLLSLLATLIGSLLYRQHRARALAASLSGEG